MAGESLEKVMGVRMAAPVADAVNDAARANLISSSAYIRLAIAERLRRDGFDLSTGEPVRVVSDPETRSEEAA